MSELPKDFKADTRPLVTKAEVKKYFDCGDDMAEDVMRCPDLHRFQVGKRFWYIDRGIWEAWITVLITRGGLRNLKAGLYVATNAEASNPARDYLLSIGMSPEHVEEIICREQKRLTSADE